MLLPVITEYSIPAAKERYADCARVMGVALLSDHHSVACQKLVAELRLLNQHLNVPSPSSYGIEKEKFFDLLPTMAQQAFNSGSPLNNPKVPTIEEMIELYRKVWADGER